MGRKKKNNDNNTVFNVKLEKHLQNTPITRRGSAGWMLWGRKNNWPDEILNLLAQSPTMSACINFCVTALIGGGVDYDSMNGVQSVPNYRYDWNTLIRRAAFDYFTFGNFALQIIKNRDGKTYSIFHQPLQTVRCSVRDNNGVITSYWLCNDWTNTVKNKPVEIPSLIMRPDTEWSIPAGKPYLFCPDEYNPFGDYYWSPIWTSALKSIQSEAEFLSFDLRTVSNIFAPAGALSLPPVDSEEEKRAILEKIQQMFSGADGAQQLLVTFRNDSEDQPIDFTPFTASNNNVDLFSSSNDRNIDRILSAFSIPSRALVGLPLENLGFSSEAAILESAFELYNTLQGNASRQKIADVINICLQQNGIMEPLILKPLSFGNTGSNDTIESVSTQDISEDNVEEQKQ